MYLYSHHNNNTRDKRLTKKVEKKHIYMILYDIFMLLLPITARAFTIQDRMPTCTRAPSPSLPLLLQ